jgi:hypothetical protein
MVRQMDNNKVAIAANNPSKIEVRLEKSDVARALREAVEM